MGAVSVAAAMVVLGSGVANASADKCNSQNVCLHVSGSGLHVNWVSVSAPSSVAGYYFAKWIYGGTEHWYWTSYAGGKQNMFFPAFENVNFKSGTRICGGVEPTKTQADYANEICADIHS